MERLLQFVKFYIVRIGIVTVSILILVTILFSFLGKIELADRNEYIADHDKASKYIEGVANNVTLFDLGLRGYYMSAQEGFLFPYQQGVELYKGNLEDLKQLAEKYNYPHLDSIDFITEEIIKYEELVTVAVQDIKNGNPEAASEVFSKDPGLYLWRKYQLVLDSLTDFFTDLEEESKSSYEAISTASFISQLMLTFLGLPVLVFVFIRLRQKDKSISSLFSVLSENNKEYVFNNGKTESQQDQKLIIEDLVQNLKKAAQFIQKITRSDLTAKWEGQNDSNKDANKNTISGELITMREQLKKLQEEEKKRFWLTDGLSKFSELVRINQDNIEKLSEVIMSEVVRYSKCNQGSLFILQNENDEEFLKLIGCYAYDKKKYLEKRIEIGQGLVGQVYLEGETKNLRDVPEGYINITSGLGEALPKNIVMVPLKTNSRIEGVLELASFNLFEDYEIEFLERLGEILASAIINANNAVQTKELLETAQQNQEEMRAQEEEMRQNMEELQATQEEMQRKESEYLERIQFLEQPES